MNNLGEMFGTFERVQRDVELALHRSVVDVANHRLHGTVVLRV